MGMYEDLVDFLFDGAVPPETIRKMNDSSEVHVPGAIEAKKKKKAWSEKTNAQKVAIATNAGGALAGPAAVYMSVKAAKAGKGGMPRELMRNVGGQRGKRIAAYLDSPKSKNAKIAAGAAGAGIVGLQALNWAGDSIATRELAKPKNQLIDEAVEQSKIKKMIHDAVFAGVPSDQIMEMIEKAQPRNAAQLARSGQRLVGAIGAGAVAAGGYVAGRKQTDKTVDEALDERGVPRPKPLSFKPLPKANYGTAPVVVESKYKPKKKEVKKSDEDLTWEGEISKVDTEKRHVFGWCSIAKVNGEPVVDRQDDYIPVDEMERSAYDYVLHSRKGGDMHQQVDGQPIHKSDMIESFVVTPEKLEKMGIDPDSVPHGWWVGFKVNDDNLWQEVKKGDKVHFSVHGRGKRVKDVL